MSNKFSKLSLGERDFYIKKLEEEIKHKKNTLINEAKEIENIKKGNKLLEGVQTKYKEYYDVAINEKQQQYDAMMLLKTYLDEVIKKEKMTKHQLKNARADKRNIILEMEKITNDLKEITK
jgi:hypothetical protein